MKKRILFICTHNSARSQMAEGYLRARYGDQYEAFSAGIQVTGVHPFAIAVMNEIDVDISGQRSKTVAEFEGREMDLVVTVCDHARSACPIVPSAKEVLHKEFPDPSAIIGAEEQVYAAFREVRDQITAWIEEYFEREVPR